MALPAGLSSDEEFSDDGLTLSGECYTKKKYVFQEEVFDSAIEKEEKFISAVIKEEIDDIKTIVDSGININYKSAKHGNWTALMHASSLGNVEIIKYLLEKGANTKEHHELVTPLLCLCDSKNRNEDELIRGLDLLIDYGADVNEIDWFKTNALVYAVKRGREKLILKLISIGCNIDSADSDGWTPVFYAVDAGYLQIVQILKDAGANIKKFDSRGRSLHDIALAKHHKEIAEIVNVAEKHVDIDEIIDMSNDYKRMSNFEYVLADLPSRSKGRFSGFHRDAVRWVYGIGLGSLVKLLLEKNVQLNELLTMEEEEFKELGIVLSYDRKKLRYCVQKFHEHGWGKNCLKPLSNDEEINLNGIAQILCNVIYQIHICSASTYFWKKNMNHQMSDDIKTYVEKLQYYIKLMQKERNTIHRIVKEIEEQDKIIPSDLILPKTKKYYSKFKIILTLAFSLFLVKALKPSLSTFSSRLQILK